MLEFNARSLCGTLPDLQVLVHILNVDIIAICETLLTKNILNIELGIN